MAIAVQVTFDCADPAKLAQFWADVLGYELSPPPPGYDTWEAFLAQQGIPPDKWNDFSAAEDPAGQGPRLFFQRVPEGKTAKNRVHLDVNVGQPRSDPAAEQQRRVDEAVERAVALGATMVRHATERDEYFYVMTDPEGNEFCLQ